MYKLIYQCNKCKSTAPAPIDPDTNTILPPPANCLKCVKDTTGFESGEIVNGRLLLSINNGEGTWQAMCLFCKIEYSVRVENIRRTKSCGCMNRDGVILRILKFEGKLNNYAYCKCKKCGLHKLYKLDDKSPVRCVLCG